MRVLVAGATGKTGSHLMSELLEKGHQPVAMVRESSDTSDIPGTAEIRFADLEDLETGVVNGVDAVIFAAGSGNDTGREKTMSIDRDGAIRLIDLAAEKKLDRFVMLSSIGADAPEEGPEDMQPYLQAKHEADEYLRQSGLSYSIVRPVSLTDKNGIRSIRLAESVDASSKAARGDVAAVLTRALTDKNFTDRTVEMLSRERN